MNDIRAGNPWLAVLPHHMILILEPQLIGIASKLVHTFQLQRAIVQAVDGLSLFFDHLRFCQNITAGGFRCEVKNGALKILQEGKTVKFKPSVEQVSFSGEYALEAGQEILYITERAVFRLTKEGVTLTEVAPGVELQKDILDHMDFDPAIAKDLKLMDERIFRPEPMGLSLLEE